VKNGEKVKMGDVIAATPAEKLGAVCHASITGRVTGVNEDWIEISKR